MKNEKSGLKMSKNKKNIFFLPFCYFL